MGHMGHDNLSRQRGKRGHRMDSLVQSIGELALSQEDPARELGISFATVNRWKNGLVKPSKLAKAQLDNFCAKMTRQGKLKLSGLPVRGPHADRRRQMSKTNNGANPGFENQLWVAAKTKHKDTYYRVFKNVTEKNKRESWILCILKS